MGNMHLVTGYAGQPHVMASDQGAFNASVFGAGQYVLDRGNKLAASVITNNNVRISDGEIMMQGRHIRLAEGYVDLTIENGAQGKKRNDLIVARYTKDSISGIEDVNLVVIKGTVVDSDPVDPAYTDGDILNDNVLLNDMPLYRLPLDGLNVGTPVSLFSMYENPSTHAADKNNPHEVTLAQIGAAAANHGHKTLLWENASPSSTFGAQTLTLNLSSYDYVAIEIRPRSVLHDCTNTCYLPVGHKTIIWAWPLTLQKWVAQRDATINTSNIVFGNGVYNYFDGTSGGGGYESGYCIPTKIYGIKGA